MTIKNSLSKSQKPRNKKGQFPEGTSGNPTGRPAGSRNKATLLCEQLLEGEAEELTRILVAKAKKGDTYALRLCLERLLPVRKERSINLELQPISNIQDLPIQYQDIFAAIGNGTITPGEGESLSNILTSHAQTMERVNLDGRVAELEGALTEVRSFATESQQIISGGLKNFGTPKE